MTYLKLQVAPGASVAARSLAGTAEVANQGGVRAGRERDCGRLPSLQEGVANPALSMPVAAIHTPAEPQPP